MKNVWIMHRWVDMVYVRWLEKIESQETEKTTEKDGNASGEKKSVTEPGGRQSRIPVGKLRQEL